MATSATAVAVGTVENNGDAPATFKVRLVLTAVADPGGVITTPNQMVESPPVSLAPGQTSPQMSLTNIAANLQGGSTVAFRAFLDIISPITALDFARTGVFTKTIAATYSGALIGFAPVIARLAFKFKGGLLSPERA